MDCYYLQKTYVINPGMHPILVDG